MTQLTYLAAATQLHTTTRKDLFFHSTFQKQGV